MMIQELPVKEKSSLGDDLLHIVCECNQDIALCGWDVAGQPWLQPGDEPLVCVVCDDFEEAGICPKCGEILMPFLP